MRSNAVRTVSQNNRIYGLLADIARAACLDAEGKKELLKAVAREVSGQEHSSLLTPSQAEAAIRLLERRASEWTAPKEAPTPTRTPTRPLARVLSFPGAAPTAMPPAKPHEPYAPRGGPRDVEGITPLMQAILQALYQALGMTTSEQQRAWSMRQCKSEAPRSQEDFDKLYEGLAAMFLRRVRPRDAWVRLQAIAGRPELDANDGWKQRFVRDLLRQFSEADDAGRLSSVLTPNKLKKLIECELACGVKS
jgi:hypothetical protein